jgi:hypothetical protein
MSDLYNARAGRRIIFVLLSVRTPHLLPSQTTYKNMKKSLLSLTAWLLSLTALLLSAMLLTSCGHKAEHTPSSKAHYGKEATPGSGNSPLAYNLRHDQGATQSGTTLEDLTPKQVN